MTPIQIDPAQGAQIRAQLIAARLLREAGAPSRSHSAAQCVLDEIAISDVAREIVRYYSKDEAREIATHEATDKRVGELVLCLLGGDRWDALDGAIWSK